MLYRIGSQQELASQENSLPAPVIAEASRCIAILDDAYDAGRNWHTTGGYVLIVEEPIDLEPADRILGLSVRPCEWVKYLSADWTATLYLLGDDYSIVFCCPKAIAPTKILKELQEEEV